MKHYKAGIASWFAQNQIAPNLLMMFFLIAGILTIKNMTKEVFPTIDPKIITISVAYPGASASDVEEAITQRAEEAVIGIDGIKRVSSTASEGIGTVKVELTEQADGIEVYNDIKNEIDRLQNFPPQDAERPIIVRAKPRNLVMKLVVYGDASQNRIRSYAEKIEHDLLQLSGVNNVIIQGGASREISIFIEQNTLKKYNLSHQEVAQKISQAAINLPGGRIETQAGDILLRVQGKRYYADKYADIVIKSLPNGAVLTLGDIAELRDGFTDERIITKFNDKSALFITINRTGTQDVLTIEKTIHDYLKKLVLPSDVNLKIYFNNTDSFKDRSNLMMGNVIVGFILLFIALLLFLDLKLAFWISMGIPVAFGGGLLVASMLGVTLNMISLFALIIVSGVVVDDAIVIGESIFYEQETYPNRSPLENVMNGLGNVIAPAMVGVSTTMIAFIPLLLTEGTFGQILSVIPVIVICILFISLLEVYLILPSHLLNPKRSSIGITKSIQNKMDNLLYGFVDNYLLPLVGLCMRYRYVAVTAVFGIIFMSFVALINGNISTVFFPQIESSQVKSVLEMPVDTSFSETYQKSEVIYQAAEKTVKQFEKKYPQQKIYEGITISVGQNVAEEGPGGAGETQSSQNVASIEVKLVEPEEREFTGLEFEKAWRKNVGIISGARNLTFTSNAIRSGNDLEIEVSHRDSKSLQKITKTMVEKIGMIEGVVSIKDSFEIGKKEYQFTLTPAGYAAGLTPQSLGIAIRSAFNGQEALRVRRGREEIKVMVRLSAFERHTLSSLDDYIISLPNGQKAPLKEMASIKFTRGESVINRVNSRRIISVIGDVDETIRTTDEVTAVIENDIIPKLKEKYPEFEYSYEGASRERQDDTASLKTNTLLAVFVIFALLMIQLRGYSMPLVIIANIPLGIAGAIYFHAIMGASVSFMSFFGIVALMGIVVNDSVVLFDYYNQMRENGLNPYEAMVESVRRRFRAIMLTTVTNVVSTLPMLLETSTQAQFLIPVTMSLSGGLMFSTVLLFFFSPPFMLILEDIYKLIDRVKQKLI